MTTYVLVHGGNLSSDTWNRLAGKNEYSPGLRLGGKIWDTIIPSLQKEHHRVFAPTLQDEHSYSLSDHIDQICALIEEHQLKDIILVGASYGGLVITGVANRMKERIDLLVYLDAAFCEPGESLFDLLKKANLNPDTATGGQARAYKEKIAFDPQTIDIIPKLYVRCTKSSFAPVTLMILPKIRSGNNWSYTELATSHVPMATDPKLLIDLLLSQKTSS